MLHARFRSLLVLALALLLSAAAMAADATAPKGELLAVFGKAAVMKDPPAGWRFLWNATGKVGDSQGYAPLRYHEGSQRYGVLDEAGEIMANLPNCNRSLNVFAARDETGEARCYIASWTMQEDAAGDVWINHGNIGNRGYRTGVLEVYLNDRQVHTMPVERDAVARLFQVKLGRLKKGDTIDVVVGPGEGAPSGGGRLMYVIEEVPEGREPVAPVAIISHPITAREPVREVDGSYPRYQARHEAHCAEMLEKKPELVFLGDSITQRWPAELLNERFGRHRPVNLGVGGDWIQNLHWRVENGVFDKVHPKVVVLLIGTNNISGRYTPEEIGEGIGAVLQTLHRKSPASKVLLLGILPRLRSGGKESQKTVAETNANLRKLADNKLVFYLDVTDSLTEKDGSVLREVMPDGLHVAMPGFIRWMNAMEPALKALLDGEGRMVEN